MMKRIFIAFLIFVLLCTASAVFFIVVTQRGVLAEEAVLFKDREKTVQVSAGSESLESLLKSDIRIEQRPAEMNEILYLQADYILGISMDYRIFFDPMTGEACIEKGLVDDKYFSISNDFISSLESGYITITNLERIQAEIIGDEVLNKFLENLVEIEELSISDDESRLYALDRTLPNGKSFRYMIHADFLNQRYEVETNRGIFSISAENITEILSSDPVFRDMAEITQPIPELVFTTGYTLVPFNSSVDWTRTRPDGSTDAVKYSDSSLSKIQMPEPETPLVLTYRDGNAPGNEAELLLTEYRNGTEYAVYDLNQEQVAVPYFEGILGYTLRADYPDGTLIQEYEIQMELPAEAQCPYPEARPGDTLAFFVQFADEDETFFLKSNIGGFEADLVPFGNTLMALVPINWWTPTGSYEVDIFRTSYGEKSLFTEYDISILPDEFETTYQQLVVSDELAEKADPVNTANDYVMVREAKASSNETSYLDGTFILPLEGEFGTSYAQTRYINGENPYRHSGLDIDGDTGDPIVACNDGVVVMAAELVRTGNTIIIDHGMNLFSSYLHMSAFDVGVGDYVEKGELIGKVGSTGFSTGPHLHWSVTLDGNYMNPLWLVENPVVPE